MTPYRFYYEVSDLDTTRIQLKTSGASIQTVLQKIFSNSNFHFSIDSLDRVFIVKRAAIQTALPADFFNRQKGIDTLKVFDDSWEEPERK